RRTLGPIDCPTPALTISWRTFRGSDDVGVSQTPLLGQGGVDAPSRKWFPSSKGAAGVVGSSTDNRSLEQTTPSAPVRDASRHLVDRRSISLCFALSGLRFAPSLAKEGSAIRLRLHRVVALWFARRGSGRNHSGSPQRLQGPHALDHVLRRLHQ